MTPGNNDRERNTLTAGNCMRVHNPRHAARAARAPFRARVSSQKLKFKIQLLHVHALPTSFIHVLPEVSWVYKGSEVAHLVIRAIVRVRLELGLEH